MITQEGNERTPKKRKSLADSLGRTQVPNVILTSPKLSPEARLLYANIKRFDDLEKGAYPGRDKLGLIMGMHPNTVDKYLNELTAFGLLRKIRRGGKKTNKFELIDIDDNMVRKLDPIINAYQDNKTHDSQQGVNHEDENPDKDENQDQDDSQEDVNQKDDSQEDVNQKDDSQRDVNHDSQRDVNHPGYDSQQDVNKKERASLYKKRAVESMLARLQSNPKYQELVGKYGEEVLLKAMKAFTNDIKEGKINKPDYPINYFLTVGEDRYIPMAILEMEGEDAAKKEVAPTKEPENSPQDKPNSPEESEKIEATQRLIKAELELGRISFEINKLQESNNPEVVQELESRLQRVERDIQQIMNHVDPKDVQELKSKLERYRDQLTQTKEALNAS